MLANRRTKQGQSQNQAPTNSVEFGLAAVPVSLVSSSPVQSCQARPLSDPIALMSPHVCHSGNDNKKSVVDLNMSHANADDEISRFLSVANA